MTLDTHTMASYTADTRCLWRKHETDGGRARLVAERVPCQWVGDYLHQVICDPCERHWIGEWNEVVEAWHDHAFPGWRDLPILPIKLRGQMGTTTMTPKLQAWLDQNYPPQFHTPGAPIRTERGKHGTRHVPHYSPFGGFDLSAGTRIPKPTGATS